ncbi:MAG: glycosyltransferase family 9 protein [Desulfovibrionaceae bacterium]
MVARATPPAALPKGGVRKILLCQLRQIGDVLLATPAARMLAERFPGAEIHFLTEKKCAQVLEHNPHIHTVWTIDKKAFGGPFGLLREVAWYWRVARQGFDIVVDFQQLPRCRWVVAFSGAPLRLSYKGPWYTRWLFTHASDPVHGYSALTKASSLGPLGLAWQGERPLMVITDKEKAWARQWLAARGIGLEHRLVTVDPSHRRATRRWPASSYGRLIAAAAAADPSLRFLVLWGPGEEGDARAVAQAAGLGARCVVPDACISLRQLAACVDAAALHVGNCSAPRHMAVAVGTPSLVVLGATSQAWTFPSDRYPGVAHKALALGLDCQPCNRNDCPRDLACLTGLAPERVLEEMLAMLGA